MSAERSSRDNQQALGSVWSGEAARSLINQLTWNEQGLIPAIVQDASTHEVLMMAYMSPESLERTCELGETVFWSRSRQSLWHKGATSGHTQRIVSMAADCDKDTLLIEVEPNGPACHTGSTSCFYETMGGIDIGSGRQTLDALEILSDLEAMIADRERERPEGAYTTYLFEKGIDKVLKKIGEESAEVIIAAKGSDKQELIGETGDLLFHVLVLLRTAGISLEEVMSELERRHNAPRRDTYNESGKVKS
ncbi:bifunctional phosphoribosyl-AMP cyclohydrolase/phosphoribosyl-ATP diphosphatase HisIE [Paenibacillus marinisediminis]